MLAVRALNNKVMDSNTLVLRITLLEASTDAWLEQAATVVGLFIVFFLYLDFLTCAFQKRRDGHADSLACVSRCIGGGCVHQVTQ